MTEEALASLVFDLEHSEKNVSTFASLPSKNASDVTPVRMRIDGCLGLHCIGRANASKPRKRPQICGFSSR